MCYTPLSCRVLACPSTIAGYFVPFAAFYTTSASEGWGSAEKTAPLTAATSKTSPCRSSGGQRHAPDGIGPWDSESVLLEPGRRYALSGVKPLHNAVHTAETVFSQLAKCLSVEWQLRVCTAPAAEAYQDTSQECHGTLQVRGTHRLCSRGRSFPGDCSRRLMEAQSDFRRTRALLSRLGISRVATRS